MGKITAIYSGLPTEDPLQLVLKAERLRIIKEIVASLTDKQKNVTVLRFGLVDGVEHSLKEISVILGISAERTRQIHLRALRAMRNPKIAPKLKSMIL